MSTDVRETSVSADKEALTVLFSKIDQELKQGGTCVRLVFPVRVKGGKSLRNGM